MQRSRLVVRNVATTLITQLLSWGMTLLVTLYLPRYVGDRGLGLITLAGSYASIFAITVGLGTSTVLIREIARHREKTGELVAAGLLIRLPLSLIAVLIGIAASFALHYSPDKRLLFAVALMIMPVLQLNDVLSSSLRGLEEIPRQNISALCEKVLVSVATLLMIWKHAPLTWLIGVSGCTTLVALTINATAFAPYFKQFKWPTWATVQSLVREGLPFLTTAVFIAVYGQCDALLLDKLSSVEAIGWYGIAKRLGGTTLVIPVALASAILPTLSRTYHESRETFERAVQRLVGLMFLLVVPFAAVLILAPKPLLELLHYPPSFLHAVPVLMILGFAIILWYISQATANALIASDRQGVLSRVTGYAALMSVPVCAALIFGTQHFLHNGAIGAIASDTIVELYMVVCYVRALPGKLISWTQVGVLVRSTIAAVPIIVPLYFVHGGGKIMFLVMLPGLLAYLPLCFALHCLHSDDVALFKSILRRKTGPPVTQDDIAQDAGYATSASPSEEELGAQTLIADARPAEAA